LRKQFYLGSVFWYKIRIFQYKNRTIENFNFSEYLKAFESIFLNSRRGTNFG